MRQKALLKRARVRLDRSNPWLIWELTGWSTRALIASSSMSFLAGMAYTIFVILTKS